LNRYNNNLNLETAVVAIIGLGYVGLPLAKSFTSSFKVIGFDNNTNKINKLRHQATDNLTITADPKEISRADYLIICVPTPVTQTKELDLSYIEGASRTIGQNMKRGSIVVLESTVYPGVTEEIIRPILEQESGLECGRGFKVGYSPERINPGDDEHTIDRMTKVVAGMDEETTELLAALYSKIVPAVYKVGNIRTAEAAKVIENIQRDLNIALMNELAMIFKLMGLKMTEVLEAAATKWNFHRYSPGLVGGHCIPVDPYYFLHKVKEMGHEPQVILAGRSVNDSMPAYVTDMTTRALTDAGKKLASVKVLIMGLTYKENVPDTRESPIKGVIKKLKESGIEVYGYDPLLNNITEEFEVNHLDNLKDISEVDAIIITVAHDSFRKIKLSELKILANDKPMLIDLKQVYNQKEAEQEGFNYLTL